MGHQNMRWVNGRAVVRVGPETAPEYVFAEPCAGDRSIIVYAWDGKEAWHGTCPDCHREATVREHGLDASALHAVDWDEPRGEAFLLSAETRASVERSEARKRALTEMIVLAASSPDGVTLEEFRKVVRASGLDDAKALAMVKELGLAGRIEQGSDGRWRERKRGRRK